MRCWRANHQRHVQPNNPLSAFDGQALANTWRITVSDNAIDDTGTLNQWCLIATTGTANGPLAYADPADSTCGGNSPCYSGSAAIQQALNFVTTGGQVTVLGNHSVSSPLTCVGSASIVGSGGASLTWSGGPGSLFLAFNCNLTVKGLALNGGSTATMFQQLGTGTITAYANNISNFGAADTGVGTPQIGHNYWGTNDPNASAPTGMPAGQWTQRLGVPVSSYADGSGSAALGNASMSGGTGTAVIVSMGRAATAANAAFFGNGVTGHVDAMCSEFYDYFTVGGGGSWTLALPVDVAPTSCTAETLNQNRLYRITDLSQCSPASNVACWDRVSSTSHSGSSLVVSGLSAADLGGTHFVAGDAIGTDPTAVQLERFRAASPPRRSGWG